MTFNSRAASRRFSVTRIRPACLVVIAGITSACGGSDATGGATTQPVVPSGAERVTVTSTATRIGLGDPLSLSAGVFSSTGAVVPGRRFSWGVSDSARARIDSTGKLIGFDVGVVDVIATSQSVTGRLQITLTAGTGSWGDGTLFGGSDNEGGENIVADSAGNVYVAGTTAGTVDGQTAGFAFGNSDALVTRFLPNGKKAWTRVVNTFNGDGANGVALAKGGGVFVASATAGASYISRVSATGKIVWTLPYRGAGINDVASDKAGNVYITGDAERPNGGSICPGVPLPAPNSVIGGGAGDGFLIKISADGTQSWCKLFTYVALDQPPTKPVPVFDTQGTSITIDETRGAVYVGGVIQLNAFFGLSPFIRRFDQATGDTRWMRFINPATVAAAPGGRKGGSIGASDAGILYSITVDGGGDVWAAVTETITGIGIAYSGYLCKVSSDGDERLRHVFVTGPTPAPEIVDAVTYRAAQNDVVAVVNRDGNPIIRNNYTSSTIVGLTIAGTEKWRTAIVGSPLPGLSAQISIRSVAASPSGDIFGVGDTGGNFGGVVNSSVAAMLFGTDIAVAHVGVKP